MFHSLYPLILSLYVEFNKSQAESLKKKSHLTSTPKKGLTTMKLLLMIWLYALICVSAYGQDVYDYSEPFTPAPEHQVDEYELEQQRLENEERVREAQLQQEEQPPVETYESYE
jgi:hypothetical protein